MKAIIHAGMPKTGSSAIQDALRHLDDPRFHVVDWKRANHSDLFSLLFHDPVEDYPMFRKNGLTRETLLQDRAHWHDLISRRLAQSTAETAIFTSEILTATNWGEALLGLRDFFAGHCATTEVIAYVRQPCSFMNSVFQQRLKGTGKAFWKPVQLWPNYRARFERLDNAFGRDFVHLRTFDNAQFPGGSVVRDFFQTIGAAPPPDARRRVNESLSLEAISLLYVQRMYGSGLTTGYAGATRVNATLTRHLKTFGDTRFSLSPGFLASALDARAEDLAWIEARMGCRVADEAPDSAQPVSGPDDLLATAHASIEAAEEHFSQLPGAGSTERDPVMRILALMQRLV